VAEPDAHRVAACSPQMQPSGPAGLTTQFDGHLHLLDDDGVERLEGVVREDLLLDVLEKEPASASSRL